MARRSLRGQVAVAGVGETAYYRYGLAPDPEFVLCLKAILAACKNAGIDPRDIDGFASRLSGVLNNRYPECIQRAYGP